MHACTESLGFLLLTLYIAEPASLSEIVTVPVAKELPSFDVVLEKALKTPTPPSIPITPTVMATTRTVRNSFRLRSDTAISLVTSSVRGPHGPPWLCHRPNPRPLEARRTYFRRRWVLRKS